jgi:hypothetical protein
LAARTGDGLGPASPTAGKPIMPAGRYAGDRTDGRLLRSTRPGASPRRKIDTAVIFVGFRPIDRGDVSSERHGRADSALSRLPGSASTAVVIAKMLAAFLGFSALVTEVATLAAEHRFNSADFFSYFTVEANTLAIISLALSSFAVATGTVSRALDLFRGAVTLYMTTTILIFIVLLSGYSSKELTAVPWDNTVLHYLIPIIIILDWLIDTPASTIAYRSAVLWLGFPLAYLFYSLIRGHFVHWYPYPFMNPGHRGYLALVITAVVIAVILAAITWIIGSTPGWTRRLFRNGSAL